MNVDDAATLQRFLAQIQGHSNRFKPNTVISSPTPQQDQPVGGHGTTLDTVSSERADEHDGTKTPPNAAVVGQDNHLLASPEAQPKPSPHHSGLRAPVNSPKTAASSPRLAAANTDNEDVGEAITKYINTFNSIPLSESMWAPKSARYKPSTLSGARSTNVLMPIKAVEPNPAANETFHRMSFKAADLDHETSENLIGEHLAQSKSNGLANKIHGAKVHDVVHAESEKAGGEAFKPASQNETVANIQSDQVKTVSVSEEDRADTAPDEGVGKENTALSTPKANLPPHLRAPRVSSQQSIKAETKVPSSKEPGPEATSTIANTSLIKSIEAISVSVGDEKAMVVTDPAQSKTLTDSSPEKEDLEHKAIFNAWPALEERRRPVAEVRTIIIKDLPRDSTATFVASVVYGGPVEEIQFRSSTAGNLSAAVRFMNAKDCKRFYEETANGLVYKKDAKGRELVLFVELAKDVDVVGGLLQGWIDTGITRCVRAVGVESKWDLDGLRNIAERKGRKVEKIVDGQNAGGARSVVFRFCRVEDAVRFKAALSRDEDWEQCNIHYAGDPCATASGVHLET